MLLLLILPGTLALPANALSMEDILDTEALTERLPESARELMGDVTPETLGEEGLPERLLDALYARLRSAVRDCCGMAGVMLSVVLVCSAAEAADPTEKAQPYVLLAGVAAMAAAAVSDVDSYLSVVLETLETLSDYSRVLLPVLAGTAAASGAVTSAAAKCAATTLFMDMLLHTASAVVIPAVCGFTALSVANAAVGNDALKMAAGLMKGLCRLLLTAMAGAFTLWLSLVSVVSGGADAAATRLAKTVTSAALPVVGRLISDAAGTLAAAAEALRGMTGAFGLLAALCICLAPFLQLGARYLIYKAAAAVCSCFAGGRLSALLDAFGTSFGLLLSLVGVDCLMVFISIYSFLKAVL